MGAAAGIYPPAEDTAADGDDVVAADAKASLERLRAALDGHGWHAELREAARPSAWRSRTVLYVRNPRAPSLNDTITVENGAFRWSWAQGIGAADDVAGAADRITFVLREADQ